MFKQAEFLPQLGPLIRKIKTVKRDRIESPLLDRLLTTLEANKFEADFQSPVSYPIFRKDFDRYGLISAIGSRDGETPLPRTQYHEEEHDEILNILTENQHLRKE